MVTTVTDAREAMMARLSMGGLEARVLEILWDRGGWLTPGEVQEALAPGHPVAYTTVKTILDRLCRKGLLERHRDGRAFVYQPVESREERVASRMTDLLADTPDPSGALVHFLDSISPAQRAQLRRMLASKTKKS